MEGTSIDPTNEKLKQLEQLLPEAFTEGKVDWEKLKATLGEDINFANERYVLNWAGKSNAFKEIKTPTTKTLVPCKEESKDWNNNEHIFIEGENLDVLKTLQKSYHNKVKMIYIDPPYNTGTDSFVYPDKFSESKDEYQKRVGDKDEEGYLVNNCNFSPNSKENGQYHSNWLNMMYPRLHLAKNLLKDDGVIFVSIDENESHNLRLIMNEIFGEENFAGEFVWKCRNSLQHDEPLVSSQTERILFYTKNISLWNKNGLKLNRIRKPFDATGYENPDNDPRGPWLSSGKSRNDGRPSYTVTSPSGKKITKPWLPSPETFKKWEEENLIWWGKEGNSLPRKKSFLSNFKGNAISDILFDEYLVEEKSENKLNKKRIWEIGTTELGSTSLKNLFGGKKLFDYPKPVSLIKFLCQISTTDDNLIMDFFSGSGTTTHAVMSLNSEDGGNRKCISVQLAEETEEKSEAFKAEYQNIADISKERIKRAAKKIKEDNPIYSGNLGIKVFKLQESNFKQWQQLNTTDADELAKQIKMFVDPVSENAINENMLYELLLKSGKDLNSSVVLKDKVYYINDNELVILLDEVSQDIIDTVLSESPNKVLVLDKLFSGNDKLKTNTKLQMDEAGIKFKTI